MRATVMYQAGDVRVETVPDPVLHRAARTPSSASLPPASAAATCGPTSQCPSKRRAAPAGDGTHAVIECVGTEPSLATALNVVRDGGVVSRLGVSQYTHVPMNFKTMMRNITLTGGAAPARAYIEDLMPDVLDGTVEPGRVFDRTVGLDDVPDGYKAMAERESLKVLIQP